MGTNKGLIKISKKENKWNLNQKKRKDIVGMMPTLNLD